MCNQRNRWTKIIVLTTPRSDVIYLIAIVRPSSNAFKNPMMVGLSDRSMSPRTSVLSVRELVDLIVSITKFQGRVVTYDHALPDGAPRKVMDDRRFRKVFPDFSFSPLQEGIKPRSDYYDSIFPY